MRSITWSTEDVKDETGQHERQHGSVITQVSIPELLGSLSDDRHLHQAQGNLLQQSHHLRLLVRQLHLLSPHTGAVSICEYGIGESGLRVSCFE